MEKGPIPLDTKNILNLGAHDIKPTHLRISENFLRALLISHLGFTPGLAAIFIDKPIKEITYNKETKTIDINFEKG